MKSTRMHDLHISFRVIFISDRNECKINKYSSYVFNCYITVLQVETRVSMVNELSMFYLSYFQIKINS